MFSIGVVTGRTATLTEWWLDPEGLVTGRHSKADGDKIEYRAGFDCVEYQLSIAIERRSDY